MPTAIWAPHCDDEIIGCFLVLNRIYKTPVGIYYASDIEQGCQLVARRFGCTIHQLDLSTTDEWDMVYCPDPDCDRHPLHQIIGCEARTMFRSGQIHRLRHYTTRMFTPYVWEVPYPEDKREALNYCYSEKKSLWEHDHRFWLFEGYWEMLRPF